VVRCLESISKQDYKHVEVVISDDSPDEDIKEAIAPYTNQLSVQYFHNQPSLRSPRNWNAALDKGKGDYLLLLHQDDWLEDTQALTLFVEALKDESIDFVFCQNTAIDEEGKKTILQARPYLLEEMSRKPNHLLLAQVIGPPSNTMLRRKVDVRYDERFIWLVDVDYYSRLLKKGFRYRYLPQHLVSIGLHEDQTTVFCRTNSDIIFKENIWFADKLEAEAFTDWQIYDYYWRLLRNYNIRTANDIVANGVQPHEIPAVISHMLSSQQKLSPRILKNGIFSKVFMLGSFLSWRGKR
jgi:glycosyltransferase involved in cell wall biosynthesis